MIIFAKIGITIVIVALICMMWFVVGSMIYDDIRDHKWGIYDSGSIFLTIFYILIASGFTLVAIYGMSTLYIGG